MLRPSIWSLVFVISACAERPPVTTEAPGARSLPPQLPNGVSARSSVAPPDAATETGAPAVAAGADAGAVVERRLQDQAFACLEDPSCPASDADRLFRAADDAHEDSVDCLRFADGDGTKRDAVRARACLERSVGAMRCEGSSAGLWQAELAIDLIDGIGGPIEIPRARKAFDDCFDDVTKQEVLAHAAAREADPATRPIDFCKDYGGTTLTGNECGARTRRQAETRGALDAKRVVTALDEEGRGLFVVASRAYAAYVDAMGAYVYEVYKDGTIRNAAALERETALIARRTAAIARLVRFAPAGVTEDAVARSSARVDAALKRRAAAAASPDVRTKIAEAQAAWLAYRDAEASLYVHVARGHAAPDAVTRAVILELNKERLSDLGRE